jgi:DNA replicative helicase MCM subunit Mcm2 (Cdc46/Mcm family)
MADQKLSLKSGFCTYDFLVSPTIIAGCQSILTEHRFPVIGQQEDVTCTLQKIGMDLKFIGQFDLIINLDGGGSGQAENEKQANHILYEYMREHIGTSDGKQTGGKSSRYSIEELRNLLTEVKDLKPKITDEVNGVVEQYLILTEKASYDSKSSMLRLVTAHAKLCQREITTLFDVVSCII